MLWGLSQGYLLVQAKKITMAKKKIQVTFSCSMNVAFALGLLHTAPQSFRGGIVKVVILG